MGFISPHNETMIVQAMVLCTESMGALGIVDGLAGWSTIKSDLTMLPQRCSTILQLVLDEDRHAIESGQALIECY